eukprot:gnl/TRDRNA2_/TRDRNA2_162670_c0_seq3.p1 gnl/TRDRNA2_/TRDRNA2_162670_c0~~gnl/TRDRNA2_/TRDRNA2_162670_c0_seq3.p1  ORF type:complete len:302 (+),score=31.23 gnl/TRDRNA2_/TRDRNA2_162670_c0_seq3:53-907(+)
MCVFERNDAQPRPSQFPTSSFSHALELRVDDTRQQGHTTTDHGPSHQDMLHLADASKNFTEIALQTGTDKVTSHSYGSVYDRFIGPMRNSSLTFIEIGFATGNSAEAWERFLPKANIVEFEVACRPGHEEGWVLNSPHFRKWKDSGRLKCGSAIDPSFVEPIVDSIGAPHIVVDDGSHAPDDMRDSFLSLFPRLQSGGLFFMEDLATSYEVDAGLGFMDVVAKPLIDDLHRSGNDALEKEQPAKFPDILSRLKSITCSKEICVFERNDMPPWRPGPLPLPHKSI